MNEDNRYEIKFILNELELLEAYCFIKSIGAFSPYPQRIINSLYFDTVDFQAVRDNLAGISNRKKVRLRWYEMKDEETFSNVNLEIKYRNGRLGSKIRYQMPDSLNSTIYNYTARDLSKYVFNEVKKNDLESDILSDIYIPILFIQYKREYFEARNGLRITIDNNISFRNILQNTNVLNSSKLVYNEHIMELKFPIEMKDEVSQMIKMLNLTPKRHSKYLTGMSKLGYTLYI